MASHILLFALFRFGRGISLETQLQRLTEEAGRLQTSLAQHLVQNAHVMNTMASQYRMDMSLLSPESKLTQEVLKLKPTEKSIFRKMMSTYKEDEQKKFCDKNKFLELSGACQSATLETTELGAITLHTCERCHGRDGFYGCYPDDASERSTKSSCWAEDGGVFRTANQQKVDNAATVFRRLEKLWRSSGSDIDTTLTYVCVACSQKEYVYIRDLLNLDIDIHSWRPPMQTKESTKNAGEGYCEQAKLAGVCSVEGGFLKH